MTPTEKVNYLHGFGVLVKKCNTYLFKAYPNSNCPVIQMECKSKWILIDTVIELINEFK